MLTCSKTYIDIPFAHRQHRHPGHCALIHGHNWSFTFTFACRERDENGFVVDFGGLDFIRNWFECTLDHACVFSADDPVREKLVAAAPAVWKPLVIPNCSCEGIAEWVFRQVDPLVRERTAERVWIAAIEVDEDSRNAARFVP
jgi:6-pyruvoyltetrahydropterin/6-carboxytetrahydropterin synthase